MVNKKIPYLCGGTFFFLLVQAKKPRSKARERENGIKDHLTDPEMMEGLIQAITGNTAYAYKSSLKKNTSQFRECRIDGSTYIPFNNPVTVSGYDNIIKNSYEIALLRMHKFAEDFLNPAKAVWLVRVLLDMIDQDSCIRDDSCFCVRRDGTFLPKTDILSAAHFELQPFLVGIAHYILTNRSDNISGQATLDAWGAKASERSERKLKKDFALGASQAATVDWYIPAEINASEGITEPKNEPDSDEEYIEAEIVDEHAEPSEKAEAKAVNQTVFINNDNGVQIGTNYGTINLSSHKDDKNGK